MEQLKKWNYWLNRHMFVLVLSAICVGFISGINKTPTINYIVIVLFAYVTFISSLNTSLVDFGRVLKKPWKAIYILILIHLIMPFLAWGFGYLCYPEDYYMRLGFFVQGSIPIGVSSLIWIAIAGGNMPVSLVAITLDTFICPFLIPALFRIVIGETVEINYLNMIIQLMLMVTIPSLIGMILHDMTHNRLAWFSASIGGFSSKVAFFCLIALNAAAITPLLQWNWGLIKLLLLILLIVACGFGLGYIASLFLRKSEFDIKVCLIYNVGIRNVAFGSVLAFTFFPLEVAMPVTLAVLFQQPLGGLVLLLLERHQRSVLRKQKQANESPLMSG